VIAKRLLTCDPEPDRRRDRDVPADAGAARRSRGLFRGPAATPEAIEQIRKKLGLDRPLPEQFFALTSTISPMAISAIR
jgi:ABC-type dipeptide/oligopeptide/nickel transport system permease component